MQIPFAGVNLIVVGYILVKILIEMVSDLFRQGVKKPPPFCSENTCTYTSFLCVFELFEKIKFWLLKPLSPENHKTKLKKLNIKIQVRLSTFSNSLQWQWNKDLKHLTSGEIFRQTPILFSGAPDTTSLKRAFPENNLSPLLKILDIRTKTNNVHEFSSPRKYFLWKFYVSHPYHTSWKHLQ